MPDLPASRSGIHRFWDTLGLTEPDTRNDWVDRATQIRGVRIALPAALFVQMLAILVAGILALASGQVTIIAWVLASATVVGLAGATMAVALIARPMRHWQPHFHARLILGLGAAQAAGLGSMLWAATVITPPQSQLAAFVVVLAALGATGLALQSIRAAVLGFAAVVVGIVLIADGPDATSLAALACLACLVFASRRLALIDYEAARRNARIKDSGRLAAQLVHEFESNGSGWFWQTDKHGRISYMSAKVAEALTLDDTGPIGQPLTNVFRMDGAAAGTERTLSFHLSSRTAFSDYSVHAASRRHDDSWWSISGRPVMDSLGRFQGFIGSGSDLTEKRRAEAEITRLALFDSLTGLANRQRMRLSLDQTLCQPGVLRRPTALFLLDLDRFKVVNDTLGHQTGDELLKQVAQRLLRSIGDAGLVGRLGGDEFQVVLPGESDTDKLSALARDVIAALSQPYSVGGASITIGCSIGVAIAPHDGDDSETLIRNADLALYAAKADGRGVHRFYRAELLHGAQNRKRLEDDLRDALVGNQFHLVYQPVVCTGSTQIVGYEALLRWEHPLRGPISPADFVPIAEDCGLIETIGEWVLRTACRDAATWPGDIRVAVNVSPIQFANPALTALVTSALAKSGIAPQRLELEITESVFLDGGEQSEAMFRSLKGIGVRLALDDFGTGYSSLGYLKNAPFDKIKIDQSFVRGAAIAVNRSNAAIIRAIVTLADTLGMETTAEGVEVQDEIDLIRALGCSHIQGFVYGRPMPTDDVVRQLREGGGAAAAPSGFRLSRTPRFATIRSAMIEIQGTRGEVLIRNLSPTGAMIDGIEFAQDPENAPLLIELLDGQMFAARVRWANEGRAGVEFDEHFNLERLTAGEAPHLRKAG